VRRAQSGARNPAHSGAILGGTPTPPPSPFRYDLAAPDAPPAVWLTYAGATNAAALHPTQQYLAVAVGERQFPLPRGGRGGGGDDDGGGGGDREAEEAEEAGALNGFQVWRLSGTAPQEADGGVSAGGEPAAEGVERGASAEEAGAPSTSAAEAEGEEAGAAAAAAGGEGEEEGGAAPKRTRRG
jgi:hypothetical protein